MVVQQTFPVHHPQLELVLAVLKVLLLDLVHGLEEIVDVPVLVDLAGADPVDNQDQVLLPLVVDDLEGGGFVPQLRPLVVEVVLFQFFPLLLLLLFLGQLVLRRIRVEWVALLFVELHFHLLETLLATKLCFSILHSLDVELAAWN